MSGTERPDGRRMPLTDTEAMERLDEIFAYLKGRIRQEREARLEAERGLARAAAEIERERLAMKKKMGIIDAAMTFSKETAAETLGISVDTLDKFKKRGMVPHRKIGDRVVFTGGDLIAFLDGCLVPATNLRSDAERRGAARKVTGAGA